MSSTNARLDCELVELIEKSEAYCGEDWDTAKVEMKMVRVEGNWWKKCDQISGSVKKIGNDEDGDGCGSREVGKINGMVVV